MLFALHVLCDNSNYNIENSIKKDHPYDKGFKLNINFGFIIKLKALLKWSNSIMKWQLYKVVTIVNTFNEFYAVRWTAVFFFKNNICKMIN